jgi:hypothetical protein
VKKILITIIYRILLVVVICLFTNQPTFATLLWDVSFIQLAPTISISIKQGAIIDIDTSDGNINIYDLHQSWMNQVIIHHHHKDISLEPGQMLCIQQTANITVKATHSYLVNVSDNLYQCNFCLHSLFKNEPDILKLAHSNNKLEQKLLNKLVLAAVMQSRIYYTDIQDDEAPLTSSSTFVDIIYPFVDVLDNNNLVLQPGTDSGHRLHINHR